MLQANWNKNRTTLASHYFAELADLDDINI